jgi:hypothetical protein
MANVVPVADAYLHVETNTQYRAIKNLNINGQYTLKTEEELGYIPFYAPLKHL